MSAVKNAIATLWRTDPRLTLVGLVMLPLLAASIVGLIVDPRFITGAPAWLKPAKFAASIAIYTLTLAWVFTFLPGWTKTRLVVSWITAVALILEIAIIFGQAWRGHSSHFNIATPLDGILFSIMGAAILVQTLSTMAVAVALWRQPFADRAMGWALRLGIVITIVGASSGGLMVTPTAQQLESARAGHRMTVAGAHTVGAPDGEPGLPGTGWSVQHGDLRVPHFLGLHALQLLPLLALVFTRRIGHDDGRVRVVWTLAASYVALFGLLIWQALRGQSLVDPDVTMLAVLAAWALATALTIWLASSRATISRIQAAVY